MKVRIDVDCSPAEARAFLGLPDVAPLQAALMAELEARMKRNMAAMDAEALMKMWLPQGLEGWQQQMWDAMAGAAKGDRES